MLRKGVLAGWGRVGQPRKRGLKGGIGFISVPKTNQLHHSRESAGEPGHSER